MLEEWDRLEVQPTRKLPGVGTAADKAVAVLQEEAAAAAVARICVEMAVQYLTVSLLPAAAAAAARGWLPRQQQQSEEMAAAAQV
jgi:hypothetical protein